MAFNTKKSDVNGVEPEKNLPYHRSTEKIAALMAFNTKKSWVNGLELEKERH